MGSSSKSSSAASSNEVADSYNTITTTSVTPTASGSGSTAFGLNNASNYGSLALNSNSGNDSNNQTDSNNYSANYGASGSAGNSSGTNGTAPTASSGFDWSDVIVWVVGGVALMFVLRAIGDKNA
jgi:hypothetical protein